MNESPPTYLRISDAIKLSGIGRTTLFSLMKTGSIQSYCVSKAGGKKGIRLICRASLIALIKSQPGQSVTAWKINRSAQ